MKKIEFVKLTNTESISTTKSYCYLNCKHCNKHYLKNMKNIEDIENLAKKGIKSFLISGGMNSKIEVPIIPFFDKLKRIKETYNIKYNIHTGIIDNNIDYIEKLKFLHDAISFDVVGNEDVYKNVYGNNYYKEMMSSFYTLLNEGFNVKPHITIGLNGGEIKHEYDVVKILQNFQNMIDEVIFIVFIPTKNTEFENSNPPNLEEIESIFKFFKNKLPNTTFTLGCMQPKGAYRKKLQILSLKYMDKITQPITNTIEYAKENKMSIHYSDECCAL